jgi:hypothetical protein
MERPVVKLNGEELGMGVEKSVEDSLMATYARSLKVRVNMRVERICEERDGCWRRMEVSGEDLLEDGGGFTPTPI